MEVVPTVGPLPGPPPWSTFSPGTVLNWMMIATLYQHNRPSRIEFGLGDSQYKQVFGNLARGASRGFYVPHYTQISILTRLQLSLLWFEGVIRELLAFVRLETIVRRWLRRPNT